MKVGHLNIRSMFTGFHDFKFLVRQQNFDVFMLSETWLNVNISSNIINIPGYTFYRHDRLGRGGGVGAYVKNQYSCQTIQFDFNVNTNLEFLFLKINTRSQNIAVGTLYRPKDKNIKNFIDDCENIFSFLGPSFDEVICLGDFNTDFFNPNNPVTSCFESFNLFQIINEPTRTTKTTNKLLDPIFISCKELVTSSGVIDTSHISDHSLTFCDFSIVKAKTSQKFIKVRSFENLDQQKFNADLIRLPWHLLVRERNIDVKVEIFNNFILSLYDRHAPIKEIRVSKPKAPWLTQNLKLIMKERDLALQKFKITKNTADFSRYKDLRNFTLTCLRREKKRLY